MNIIVNNNLKLKFPWSIKKNNTAPVMIDITPSVELLPAACILLYTSRSLSMPIELRSTRIEPGTTKTLVTISVIVNDITLFNEFRHCDRTDEADDGNDQCDVCINDCFMDQHDHTDNSDKHHAESIKRQYPVAGGRSQNRPHQRQKQCYLSDDQ